MCLGIAIPIDELPEVLLPQHRLADRIVQRERGSPSEFRFLWRHRHPLLPVYLDHQLQIVKWGSRQGPWPVGGWCHQEWIAAGLWKHLHPRQVIIVATLALERGVRYQVKEGIQGMMIRDQVYMLTEPASHYYRIMTRSNRMPVLIGQRI
jgi:hypothetical protein